MPILQQPYFSFTKLDNPRKGIRLLKLEQGGAGNGDDNLQCRLFNTPLASAEDYIALSYEWGTSMDTTQILVNGCRFIVRKSLHTCLQTIYRKRHFALPFNLWVDAICIDQNPDENGLMEEKNEQVKLMSQIFSKARLVAACLGKGDDHTALAHKYLTACCERYDDLISSPFGDPEFDVLYRRKAFLEINDQLGGNIHDIYLAFQGIIESTYWTRLWMVQEVTLSSRVEFYCGDEVFTTNHLQLLSLFAEAMVECSWFPMKGYEISPEVSEVIGDFRDVCDEACSGEFDLVDQLRRRIARFDLFGDKQAWPRPRRSHQLADCVVAYHKSGCGDPRDHVYGLLGMATDVGEQQLFPVDYNLPPVELLVQTVIWCRTAHSQISWNVARCLAEGMELGFPKRITTAENAFFALDEQEAVDYCKWATTFSPTWENLDTNMLQTIVELSVKGFNTSCSVTPREHVANHVMANIVTTRTVSAINTGYLCYTFAKESQAPVEYLIELAGGPCLLVVQGQPDGKYIIGGIAYQMNGWQYTIDWLTSYITAHTDFLKTAEFHPRDDWLSCVDMNLNKQANESHGRIQITVRDLMVLLTLFQQPRMGKPVKLATGLCKPAWATIGIDRFAWPE